MTLLLREGQWTGPRPFGDCDEPHRSLVIEKKKLKSFNEECDELIIIQRIVPSLFSTLSQIPLLDGLWWGGELLIYLISPHGIPVTSSNESSSEVGGMVEPSQRLVPYFH